MTSKANLPLAEFFDKVYRPRRLLGCSPLTIDHYAITLRHFGRYLKRKPKVSDLDEGTISEFLAKHIDGRSSSTVWSAQKHLVALGNYAHKKGLLREAPEVRRITVMTDSPTSYSVEEVGRLIRAARETPGTIAGILACKYWPAVFLTVYYAGLRHGTLFRLRLSDVDFASGVIRVPASTQKNKHAQTLRIPVECMETILTMENTERELLFPWKKCRRVKYCIIRKIFKAAGLPHGRRDLLQKLRRTCASLAHKMGVDACRQLDHSSDAITRKHYLDFSDSQQAGDVLPSPLGAGSQPLPISTPKTDQPTSDPKTVRVTIDDTIRKQREEHVIPRGTGELLSELLTFCAELTVQRLNFVLVAGMNPSGLLLTWRYGATKQSYLKPELLESWQRKLNAILGIEGHYKPIEARKKAPTLKATTLKAPLRFVANDMSNPLEKRLREAVAKSGKSVSAVAIAAGVSPAVLYRFTMGGQPHVQLHTAQKLCAYFGLAMTPMPDRMEQPAA